MKEYVHNYDQQSEPLSARKRCNNSTLKTIITVITNLTITGLTAYIVAEAEITIVEAYVVIPEVIPRAINQDMAKINVKRGAMCATNQVAGLLGILLTNDNKYIPNSATTQNIHHVEYL